LSAAERVSSYLGYPDRGEWANWLDEAVGQLCAADESLLRAIVTLGVPILTTNYDDILASTAGLIPVTWREPERVQQVLRGKEGAIVHLHGHWRRPDSVVLGVRSYEQPLRTNRYILWLAVTNWRPYLITC
jgi:hypothetical protein